MRVTLNVTECNELVTAGVTLEQLTVFIKIVENMQIQEDREQKLSNAERQKRYRERNGKVTRRVTLSGVYSNTRTDASGAQVLNLEEEVIKKEEVKEESKINVPSEKKRVKKIIEYSENFEVFWRTYPKNGASKFEALKSYNRAITGGTEHADIMESLEGFKKHLERSGTSTAHATTWLNQRRWEIDYGSIGETVRHINGSFAHGKPTGQDIVRAAIAATTRPHSGIN